MKALGPLISMILVIAISLATIIIVYQVGIPKVERAKEILLLKEAKDNMNLIDASIRDVLYEGKDSSRKLDLTSSGGTYLIDIGNDEIIFSMYTKFQIVGEGVSKKENNIYIIGEKEKIYLKLLFNDTDISGGGEFGKGRFNLFIKNNGWDDIDKKQLLEVKIK